MTGLPAALSAFAFASTARVADSVIAAMRREMRRCAGGSSDRAGSGEETAVMPSSCQRHRPPRPRVSTSAGRWLTGDAVPYTGCPGAVDPATGVPRNHSRGPGVPWRGRGPHRGVAQLAEQRSPKPQAAGSSPVTPASTTHEKTVSPPERPPPRGERGAVSDEKRERDDVSDAELTDEELDAQAPGVDDAAELEAAEAEVAAEAEEDEEKVVATSARRRRGRITADEDEDEDDDDEDEDEPAPRSRRAARERTPSRPATR